MTRTLRILAAALFLFSAAGASAAGKAPKGKGKGENIESKAVRNRGGAPDENVKSEEIPKNPAAKATPQPDAGKKRGACAVKIDSRVNLYVKIFVDGDYRGMVGPNGDGYTLALSGPTKLYARADFDDGTSSSWGPKMVNCPDGGVFTWTLTY